MHRTSAHPRVLADRNSTFFAIHHRSRWFGTNVRENFIGRWRKCGAAVVAVYRFPDRFPGKFVKSRQIMRPISDDAAQHLFSSFGVVVIFIRMTWSDKEPIISDVRILSVAVFRWKLTCCVSILHEIYSIDTLIEMKILYSLSYLIFLILQLVDFAMNGPVVLKKYLLWRTV